MNNKIFYIVTVGVYFTLLFLGGYPTFGQRHSLEIGTGQFRVTVYSILTGKTTRIKYPEESRVYTLKSRNFNYDCSRGGGILIAAKNFNAKAFYMGEKAEPNSWTIMDSLHTYFVVDATDWYTVDQQHSTVPVSTGALRYWRQRPPVRMVESKVLSTRDWTNGRDIEGPADIPTTQMGIVECRTYMGINVIERTYVVDNADFAVLEYVFKYTGETGDPNISYSDPINDCYIGIKFHPIIANSDVVNSSTGWGEATDDWVDYVHEEDGERLRVLYGWDGDAGDRFQPEDDEGDPLYFSSGWFVANTYAGMTVLHVDKSVTDHTDDPDQPHRFHVSYGGDQPANVLSVGRLPFKDIYRILDQGPDAPSPFDWVGWKAAGRPVNDSQFWYYNTPHATDERRFNQLGTLAFGPYNFNLGDSIQVVVCYAAGSIGHEKAVEMGSQWKAGQISREEKNRTLRSSRDSLFAKIKWIKELVEPKLQANNNNVWAALKDVATEIGTPPAWPDSLILDPIVGGCQVRWTPVEGAVGYRVYRRDKIDFDPATPQIEPAYSLVYQCGGENPGGGVQYSPTVDSTTWVDRNVYKVFNYWYYVTSLDADGNESSRFIARTYPTPADNYFGSVQPFGKEYTDLDDIHVLPNPYHVKALKLYDWGEDQLQFINLPANCRIRVFAQNGDLVYSGDHESEADLPNSRFDWKMRTNTNQNLASGLYFYVIDQCRDFDGNDIPATKVGKFVVIR